MATTYKAIATITVGSSGVSYFEFTNIPQTYTDLAIFVSSRTNDANTGEPLIASYNGGASGSKSSRYLYANNTASVGSQSSASYNFLAITNAASSAANYFSNSFSYIPNYTSSNYKAIATDYVREDNASTFDSLILANLWSSTSAITSIKLTPISNSTIQQYSTATLYGIKNS